jgi:beta-fructofuranosidase
MLALDDYWIWDSWIADDGETYHLYFLQAPRSLLDPGRRHTSAQIGHATSTDLINWTYQGVALAPGHRGAWDDLALWTGSTVRGDDGVWRMYYTAISGAGRGVRDQRIGLAESDDLFSWRRVGDKPLLEADPRWYATLGLDDDPVASETWRDPFVFRDPAGDGWHMYITARVKGAQRLNDGVIAHARSADLLQWEIGPPLSEPAGFGQLEVLQVRVVEGRPILVFTCGTEEQGAGRQQQQQYCTWSVPGESITGPWNIVEAQPFVGEPDLFAAPLVQDRAGRWNLVGFTNLEPKGINSFEILDPIPVTLWEGLVVAVPGYESVGEALLRARTDSQIGVTPG